MNYNWIVSFNDGQRFAASTILEKDEKVNPWNEVIKYLKENPDKWVTHIQIVVNGVRYNTPTKSEKSHFGGSSSIEGFWILHRKMSYLEPKSKIRKSFDYIGYTYKTKDFRTFFWVNTEDNSTYTQVLNVKEPITEWEKTQIPLHQNIEEKYGQIKDS